VIALSNLGGRSFAAALHSKGEDAVRSAGRLPKSHPGSAAIFVDELHAGGF